MVLGRLSATRLAEPEFCRRSRAAHGSTSWPRRRRRCGATLKVQSRKEGSAATSQTCVISSPRACGWPLDYLRTGPDAEEDGPTIPAHVRCLLESISTQRHGPSLLWIEDRALSRATSLGCFTCRTSLTCCATGTPSMWSCESTFWKRLAAEATLAALRFRRVSNIGRSCAGLRRRARLNRPWRFCASRRHGTRRSCVSGHHAGKGADGHIVGEARRLLDAWGIARDLLARIWEDADGSEDVRRPGPTGSGPTSGSTGSRDCLLMRASKRDVTCAPCISRPCWISLSSARSATRRSPCRAGRATCLGLRCLGQSAGRGRFAAARGRCEHRGRPLVRTARTARSGGRTPKPGGSHFSVALGARVPGAAS